METSVRFGIPLLVGLFATFVGIDRYRNHAFFPLMTIIVASYFKLLFVTGSAIFALFIQGSVLLAFLAALFIGKKPDVRAMFARLAGYGLFDAAILNPKAEPAGCACSGKNE